MYYLVERYSDYDSVEFNVIEFSENQEYLEEKSKKLNILADEKRKIYNNVQCLIDKLRKTSDFFKYNLHMDDQKAAITALNTIDIPENLKQYIQLRDGRITYCEILSNYPRYYVDQIREPDIKL